MPTPAEMLTAAIARADWDGVKRAQALLVAASPPAPAAPAPRPAAAAGPNRFDPKAFKAVLPRKRGDPKPKPAPRDRPPAPPPVVATCGRCKKAFEAHPDDLGEVAPAEAADGPRIVRCPRCLVA